MSRPARRFSACAKRRQTGNPPAYRGGTPRSELSPRGWWRYDGRVDPRDWFVDPARFGLENHGGLRPAPAEPDAAAERRAAWFQHLFVVELRRLQHQDGLTVPKIARAADMNPGTLRKIVAGDDRLTIATMLRIVVGVRRIDLWPAPREIAEIDP